MSEQTTPMTSDKVLAGRYRLLEQIGLGGMALVWKAQDLRTGHHVAVKVLRPEYNRDAEFVSRFQREAEAASKMTHHNIVNLLDVGMDGENRYLVMEYVQGQTLKEVIRERGRLSPMLACQIAIRILSALEHAHRNGIVHRDIKPQNILIHADGHVKVSDFGIARIADAATLTRGDNVMGSVHYFSPEQARGETVDATGDLYSVGVVLYEMLTGRVPFDGDNPVAVAMQHLHAVPTPIRDLSPDVPPAVTAVVMKAMAKQPEQRYPSARDMAADLRAAMEERGISHPEEPKKEEVHLPVPHVTETVAEPDIRTERRKRQRRRWILISLVSAIAVFAVLVFGAMAIYRSVVTSAPVPDVVSLPLEEARRQIIRKGLNVDVVEIYSDDYAAGMVLLQTPEEDTTLRKGDTVLLTVSLGPTLRSMPLLTGMTATEASAILKDMGITMVTMEKAVSQEAVAGMVLSQLPEMGAPLTDATEVTLTVSGGSVLIPDLIGKTLEDAEILLPENNLSLSASLQFADTDDPALHGLIAQTSPVGNTAVIQNALVQVTLWRCSSCVRTGTLMLTLPAAPEGEKVRITIQPDEALAEYPAVNFEASPETEETRSISLTLPDDRIWYYNIYINDVQLSRQLLETGT